MNDIVFVDKPLIAPILLLVIPIIAAVVALGLIVHACKRHKNGIPIFGIGTPTFIFLGLLMVALIALTQSIATDIASALSHPSESMSAITMINVLARLSMFTWTPAVLLTGMIVLYSLCHFLKK